MGEFTEDGATRNYAAPEPAKAQAMQECAEKGVTRDYAAPEPASETISESEALAREDDGDLPFRHTRPYFEWERNRGNRVDDAVALVPQTSYPAYEVDLRPKRLDPSLFAFNDRSEEHTSELQSLRHL